jgi:methyl-accepting chemotaxis protein
MAWFGLLHHHQGHRSRQLRWIVPIVGTLFAGGVAVLVVQYMLSDQAVETEFFRAHKTIHHTGELLERGFSFGLVMLALMGVMVGVWALRVTHRIVRPVHTLHRALEALLAGDLGVRVELHRQDEFQEVGEALNRLADEFAATLGTVHGLTDRIESLAAEVAREAHDASAEARLHALAQELDRTMEFFRLEPRRLITERTG